MMRFAVMVLFATVFFSGTAAAGSKLPGFSPYVDAKGNITLPGDIGPGWVHLGTWVAASKQLPGSGSDSATAPVPGFHEVYTQDASLRSYRKTGTWPDGSVIIMEVRALGWDDLSTGHVMFGGDPVQWFVMIKDGKARFAGNPQWGDGWGWAMFRPSGAKVNAVADYRKDCLNCHEAAKESDWLFLQGYPALR